jgi:hypothetical protein
MKNITVLFLLLNFIFWILPLGIFIKPSHEKLACDGQRAICMCHAFIPKSMDKAMEHGMALKTGGATNKENAPNAGNYFVSAKSAILLNLPFASVFDNQRFFYKSPYLTLLESVPKV